MLTKQLRNQSEGAKPSLGEQSPPGGTQARVGKLRIPRPYPVRQSGPTRRPRPRFVRSASGGDLIDDTKSTKGICKRSASDIVNGQPATFYELQLDTEGTILESRTWVSSKGFISKSEGDEGTIHHTTVYDSSRVTPPPNAKRMGVSSG
jgi:hypothetical protein